MRGRGETLARFYLACLVMPIADNESLALTLASAVIIWVATLLTERNLRRKGHLLAAALNTVRVVLVPSALLLWVIDTQAFPRFPVAIHKIIETIFWVGILWFVLSLAKALLYTRRGGENWQARVPGLLLDVMRVAFVLIGTFFVIAHIWEHNIGNALTTLGIGSVVVGLALQDTLGSFFAGVALFFEKPFAEGDWISVKEVTGEVTEMNWRSVRLVTRDYDRVVLPNSLISKELIYNYSKPTRTHGILLSVAFSYNDPPNRVKRVLQHVAYTTQGILHDPAISVRTISYQDFSILYQVRCFIEDFRRLPEIEEEFMTQIWYAARRAGLTIPFPIRTVYKTEVPSQIGSDTSSDIIDSLAKVPLFQSLTSEERAVLASDAVVQDFARSERIVVEGEGGDALYIIRRGSAAVTTRGTDGREQEIAQLKSGDFFGEMSLVSGESRSATVSALEDVEVISIFKDSLASLVAVRPSLLEELSALAEQRRALLSVAQADQAAQVSSEALRNAPSLREKIRRFLERAR